MTRYLLSPAAQADLSEIWDYTATRWGADQADRYIRDMRDACEALSRGETRGRPADDIRPGYLKLRVASHVLFFRTTEGGAIDVVRILHQRMDPASRLD